MPHKWIILFLLAFALQASAAPKAPWAVVAPGKGGEYRLDAVSPEEFTLTLKRNAGDAPAAVQICRDIDRETHSQYRLQFSCRVADGKSVVLQPLLSYLEGEKKSVMRFGPKLDIRGDSWKDYSFPLDSTFKLGDAVYNLRQLKLSVSISGAPDGTEARFEARNIRIIPPDEAGLVSGKNEVVVHPPARPRLEPAPDAVRVFFHFDNEDFATLFDGRGNYRRIRDRQAYPGFRHVLIETARREIRPVATPEEAEVIVYSAARPEPALARRIADAVKQGTPLVAASAAGDPEIAALLPAEIKELPNAGLPERKCLKTADANDPLFSGLNTAAFGVYTELAPRENSKVRLSFADGKPAVVAGKAGEGRVIYSAIAFGADLIPGRAARDPFLLRAIAELTGKPLPDHPRKPVVPDANGYYAGAGEDNFGRFGILLGDGLLVETINNVLAVTNHSQEYRFTAVSQPKITLDTWRYTPPAQSAGEKAGEVNWRFRRGSLGNAEFTAECVVPAEWKGKPVRFAVENGIDDTAELYFNDTLIGKVTADMPDYWKRPHRHDIPPEAIRFGAKNRIRIVTGNLRGEGGFGSCPELVQPHKAEAWKFVPDRVNWLGKGGIVTESNGASRRFDTSLAFPGVRWEIFSDHVELELHNIAEFAAFETKDGVRILDLKKNEPVPTGWSAPWLLLFKKNADHPLLLVFAHRPEELRAVQVGGSVSGLVIRRKGGIGMILPLWPWGRETVDVSGWEKKIPEAALERISFWTPRAFRYPVAAHESFRLDPAAKRVRIRTSYDYRETPNDWNVRSAAFAPVSPLAFFTRGVLFESAQAEDWKLVTGYGNYAAHDNSDTVEWSLPLPETGSAAIPAVAGHDKAREAGNRVFQQGVRWSAGGSLPEDAWTPAYPTGKPFPDCFNINMHGWLMGLNQVLLAPYELDDASRSAFLARLRKRFFEAVERYQYKSALRWREEPMSAIRYPIFFNNRHPHDTRYAGGTGTAINYADANETAYMILSIAQMLADRGGQRDFVRANGNFLRDAARLPLVSDDWAYMACHCRESGQSATIDMLNCEYASMLKLARLAELLGDEPLRAQALYRAARRMVPTIARLSFAKYETEHKLTAYPGNIQLGVGFAEDGFSFRSKGTLPNELDLFDTSQGTPEELAPLYRKYAPVEIADYFRQLVIPSLYGRAGEYQLSVPMTGIIAQGSDLSRPELEKLIDAALANLSGPWKNLGRDWPGMCLSPNLSQMLFTLDGAVKIRTAKDLALAGCEYDPATKTLRLDLTPGENAELELETALEPADSTLANRSGTVRIPLEGRERRTLQIRFR